MHLAQKRYTCPACREKEAVIMTNMDRLKADKPFKHSFCYACDYSGKYYPNYDEAVSSLVIDLVMGDVIKERKYQDEKHGGPVHDDLHHGIYFIGLIEIWTRKAFVAGRRFREKEMRKRLVQVAALAIAAIESYDRCPRNK